ncbi:MAG: helix-turn-helix transcriptional regulator [Clostridia bacterium]|jgi:transcriptional regulator with XRE-family HTH domain|nr:helix-turn-helix transcriptional regulator [Clostridia bacterium]
MYGQRIKEIRQEKGLTQSQLAEMLSTTQSTVGKYEREEIQLTVDTIIKICKVFEVSADYLLGLED